METILIIIGILLVIAGFFGSLLPIIPGPPLSYLALLALQLTSESPFSATFLLLWLGIVIVVMVADNFIPVYGTKKFGGSKYGVWGSVAGLLVGFLFPPLGLIIGPLAGAFIGEVISGKNHDRAMRSAFGSFMGVMAGTVLKLIVSGMIAYYFIINL